MERLCERPGCSDPASVSYGMRAADLVFWLDSLSEGDDPSHGVLCRRHADSMVVPRNWTLDDIRDPELHLFRPPARRPDESPSRRSPRRRPAADQLELGIDANDGAAVAARPDRTSDDGDLDGIAAAADPETVAADPAMPADTDPPEPWTPDFDNDDDLDGLLAARSPLLARAFRGADRKPQP